MKNRWIFAACVAVVACACQPKAPAAEKKMDKKEDHSDRSQSRGGCCEVEKPKEQPQVAVTPAVQEKAPEVNAETAKAQ